MPNGELFARELSVPVRDQFHLAKIQLFNWGTFTGVAEFKIAEKGYLFVGPSGSGKSTILDAHAALLTPPKWLDFNVAAREAERRGKDRSAITYVRGAWAEQTGESGEVSAQHLRSGTTWSAIAETYRHGNGSCVVLAQVLWIRGNASVNTDIKKQFIVLERDFDVRELQFFAAANFEVRRLKRELTGAFVTDEFSAYQERFRRLLGIESERALRLLHKTQSAKSLGELNTFLRDFMLDDPETFEVADRLVAEFGELHAAHQAVVTARRQIEVLVPARSAYTELLEQKKALAALEQLWSGVPAYRDIRRRGLLEAQCHELRVNEEGASLELHASQEKETQEADLLRSLEDQNRGMGGGLIEHLNKQIEEIELQKQPCLKKREAAASACSTLGWSLPDGPVDFVKLSEEARVRLTGPDSSYERHESHKDALKRRQEELGKKLQSLRVEVESMERQPSNIPSRMLAARHAIAVAARLRDDQLPFVGELLEVKQTEARWRGAIERVLHGFAISLLVDEQHYADVASFVNRQHFNERIVYLRIRPESVVHRVPAPESVATKLSVARGKYEQWLRSELNSRYDHACAESDQDFRAQHKAITESGQVKHSSTRHEKDDRYRVDDPKHWVLGFDNKSKLELFKKEAHDVAAQLVEVDQALARAKDEDKRRQDQLLACQNLANTTWTEIDIQALIVKVDALRKQVELAREAQPSLKVLERQIDAQRDRHKKARGELVKVEAQLQTIRQSIADAQKKLKDLERDPSRTVLTEEQQAGLAERFAAVDTPINLDTLADAATRVTKVLGDERGQVNRHIGELTRHVEDCFKGFNVNWPADSGGLDPTLASSDDYFARLSRLESDGLPKFEKRFLDLLHEQSDQNLMLLSTRLEQERKAIRDRMDMVNDSLRRAPFNPGTHLTIETMDRQLEEVRAFKRSLTQALSHSFTNEAAVIEERFDTLSALVKRLASQDVAERNWRALVLDVRQHVEFIAKERDESNREVEVYRSGAGKSGGQRQKLAGTCLAAALRYQLGGSDRSFPSFSTVVLDEAMDKSDAEFTTLAMNIFKTFGFQMIVATPLKSVMTLEPFIGGAAFVHIRDRKSSAAIPIEYDAASQRLQLTQEIHDAEAAAAS